MIGRNINPMFDVLKNKDLLTNLENSEERTTNFVLINYSIRGI